MKENKSRLRLLVRALVLVIVLIVLWWLLFAEKSARLSLETPDRINITPQQIERIRSIGQWEFLSISQEELVDTVRKGLFRDDQLVRIYYGTLRLGIDMSDVRITVQGDSILLTAPPVGLLDRQFIDEARTKSFHESGSWQPADREALYQKARRLMLSHGLTSQNLALARENAETQLQRMMQALGYQHITIRFEQQ